MAPRTPDPEFCDLCSESIPHSDLARGDAVRLGARRVCAGCRRQLADARASHARPTPAVPSPRPRHASLTAIAALLLAGVAAVGAATVGVLARQQVRTLGQRVSGIDPAQAERVERLENQLDGVDRRLERWFDDQWARAQASLPAVPSPPPERSEVDLLPLRAALEDLALADAERRAALEERLAALEAQVRAAQALASAAQPEPRALDDMTQERRTRLELLRSSEPARRARALLELSASPQPDDAPFTAGLLRDPDAFVRAAAARHLELCGARHAVGALIEALADPDATVRACADSALRSLTGQAFLFDPFAPEPVRARGLAEWRTWWASTWREFLFRATSTR